MFINDHCREEHVEAVLISLDSKNAFDSMDHGYMETTLKRNGFGPKLIIEFVFIVCILGKAGAKTYLARLKITWFLQ